MFCILRHRPKRHTDIIPEIRRTGEAEEVLVAVSGGVLEVQPDKITVLADVAVRSTEMDQARAEEAKKAAEAGVSAAKDDKSLSEAHKALAAAIAQLKTLDYLRSQKNK